MNEATTSNDAAVECTDPHCVSRRTVVRAGAAAGLAGAMTVASGNARYAFAEPFGKNRPVASAAVGTQARQALVVLSLRGGFDGLNAIVPAADPQYAALRPTVGVPASRLTKLTTTFGMHPAMAPLMPFWQAGTFGVVHAVGQPNPTRSHFAAMAELERAAPGTSIRTGWLDRLLAVIPSTTEMRAVQLGGVSLLGSLVGPQNELMMDSLKKFMLGAAWDATERTRWIKALNSIYSPAPAALGVPATAATAALARVAALGTYVPANGASYPDSDLGRALRDTAQLIKAKVGLRVAALDVGQWDLHVNFGALDGGNYSTMLGDLASSMAAFATDLGRAAMQDVTLVTLSEFGRRVAENGSGGTDHGLGNAVLLLGGGVIGGRVHGRWPGLSPAALDQGDLASTTDYRLLLAEIATNRFGAPWASTVFPGLTGTPLGIVRRATA